MLTSRQPITRAQTFSEADQALPVEVQVALAVALVAARAAEAAEVAIHQTVRVRDQDEEVRDKTMVHTDQ